MNVLIIVGSLRKDSFNKQMADKAVELMAGAEVRYLEIGDVPFMNQDIEHPVPDAVARIRDDVRWADVLCVFTPEYNYGMSGVLKNATDWLSRPADPLDRKSQSVIAGKKAVIAACAGGTTEGKGALSQLKENLSAIGVEVLNGDGYACALTGEEFATNRWQPFDERIVALQGSLVAKMK